MSKDTISVNMNVYDIPIVVEQLKKLEQENKQLTKRNKELEDGFKASIEELSEYATKIDKVIEYIKELYIAEYDGNSYYIKDKNNNELGIEDIGGNILEILGDKENE